MRVKDRVAADKDKVRPAVLSTGQKPVRVMTH